MGKTEDRVNSLNVLISISNFFKRKHWGKKQLMTIIASFSDLLVILMLQTVQNTQTMFILLFIILPHTHTWARAHTHSMLSGDIMP